MVVFMVTPSRAAPRLLGAWPTLLPPTITFPVLFEIPVLCTPETPLPHRVVVGVLDPDVTHLCSPVPLYIKFEYDG